MKIRNLYIVTMLFCAAIFVGQQASASCNYDGTECWAPPEPPECTIGATELEWRPTASIRYEICLERCVAADGRRGDGRRSEYSVICGNNITEELEYYIHSNGVETRLNASNENCRVEDLSLKCYNDDITIVNNAIQLDGDFMRDDNIYEHFPCSRDGRCAIVVKYGTVRPIMIRETLYAGGQPIVRYYRRGR